MEIITRITRMQIMTRSLTFIILLICHCGTSLSIPASFSSLQQGYHIGENIKSLINTLEYFELDTHIEVFFIGRSFEDDLMKPIEHSLNHLYHVAALGNPWKYVNEKVSFHLRILNHRQISSNNLSLEEDYEAKLLAIHQKAGTPTTLFIIDDTILGLKRLNGMVSSKGFSVIYMPLSHSSHTTNYISEIASTISKYGYELIPPAFPVIAKERTSTPLSISNHPVSYLVLAHFIICLDTSAACSEDTHTSSIINDFISAETSLVAPKVVRVDLPTPKRTILAATDPSLADVLFATSSALFVSHIENTEAMSTQYILSPSELSFHLMTTVSIPKLLKELQDKVQAVMRSNSSDIEILPIFSLHFPAHLSQVRFLGSDLSMSNQISSALVTIATLVVPGVNVHNTVLVIHNDRSVSHVERNLPIQPSLHRHCEHHSEQDSSGMGVTSSRAQFAAGVVDGICLAAWGMLPQSSFYNPLTRTVELDCNWKAVEGPSSSNGSDGSHSANFRVSRSVSRHHIVLSAERVLSRAVALLDRIQQLASPVWQRSNPTNTSEDASDAASNLFKPVAKRTLSSSPTSQVTKEQVTPVLVYPFGHVQRFLLAMDSAAEEFSHLDFDSSMRFLSEAELSVGDLESELVVSEQKIGSLRCSDDAVAKKVSLTRVEYNIVLDVIKPYMPTNRNSIAVGISLGIMLSFVILKQGGFTFALASVMKNIAFATRRFKKR